MKSSLRQALQHPEALLLLDGATGTQLQYYGFPVDRPGWSARAILEAPELLLQIHREYVQAGSQLITANTFRTHQANLQVWGQGDRAGELTHKAVELARQAAGEEAWVLGAIAPIGDCYSPEEVPLLETLFPQHQQIAEHLSDADVDGVLLETHVSLPEVLAAARAVEKTGLPMLVSVTSSDGTHMLDGTPLSQLAQQLEPFQPVTVGVNCVPVERVSRCLEELRTQTTVPLIVYANTGELTSEGTWRPTQGADPVVHTQLAAHWKQQGMQILGGCCGTTPELIANFSRNFPQVEAG